MFFTILKSFSSKAGLQPSTCGMCSEPSARKHPASIFFLRGLLHFPSQAVRMVTRLMQAVRQWGTKLMPTSIFRENLNPRHSATCPSSKLAVGS